MRHAATRKVLNKRDCLELFGSQPRTHNPLHEREVFSVIDNLVTRPEYLMAVNVPLADGPQGSFPLPFQGEVFLLTRDKTEVSFKDQNRSAKRLKGRLFVTNSRMVLLVRQADREKAGAETVEMPFRGLWNEKLNQPIFGCINLTASVEYYDGQPFAGDLTMRIDFIEGGVNTFLPVFNNVLRATRVQVAHEQQAQGQAASMPIAPTAPQASSYFPGQNEAFVDPQDPSRIYTTQPVVEQAELRQEAPAWSPSREGLRRR